MYIYIYIYIYLEFITFLNLFSLLSFSNSRTLKNQFHFSISLICSDIPQVCNFTKKETMVQVFSCEFCKNF